MAYGCGALWRSGLTFNVLPYGSGRRLVRFEFRVESTPAEIQVLWILRLERQQDAMNPISATRMGTWPLEPITY